MKCIHVYIILPALFAVGYLCTPAANIYKIDFVRFKIRDIESGDTLFEVNKSEEEEEEEDEDTEPQATRYVKYHFPPQFLKLKRVGAT